MKRILLFLLFVPMVFSQNVGIGTATPNSSAILELKATDQGFLMTRVALTGTNDVTTISSPVTGLLVYNTATAGTGATAVTPGFYYWDGSQWVRLLNTQSDAWKLLGNAGTDPAVNFLGTTDNQPLVIRTNNVEHFRFTTKGQLEILNTGNSVFIGEGAGANDDLVDNRNVFIGYQAGLNNTSGRGNTISGYQALRSNTSGGSNVALGPRTLYSNTTGMHNIAIGDAALYSNSTRSYSIAIGYAALYNNNGFSNIAIGDQALYSNTTGQANIAIGSKSLYANNKGSSNIAIGKRSLEANTTGNQNIAIGGGTLTNNTTGRRNVAVGALSLEFNETGDDNIAQGFYALHLNTSGEQNMAIGVSTLEFNTTGNLNVAVGAYTLQSNGTGSYNTAVGANAYNTNPVTTNFNNSTAIGYRANITGDNQIHLGNTSITEIAGQVNFSTYSDARIKENITENVVGLPFILRLRPVTYTLNIHRQNDIMGTKDTNNWDQKYAIEEILFSGFIAQEVRDAADKANYNFSGVKEPANSNDLYKLSYAEFVVPLVKAVQEQQKMIEQQQREIDKLKKEVQHLRNSK